MIILLKKSVSLLLSFMIVVTMLSVGFTTVSSAESTSLIKNGDFGSGDTSGWTVYKNGVQTDFEVTGDSKYADGDSGLSLFQQVTLEGGVEYTAMFDFKFEDSSLIDPTYDSFYRAGFTSEVGALGNAIFVGPYVNSNNKYYHIFNNLGSDKDNWATHSFTFTPAEDMTAYFVVGSYNHQGVSGFSVDNVLLFKTMDKVKIDVAAEANGTAAGAKTTCVGETVTVVAEPDAGYKFAGWYNDTELVSTDATYSFTAEYNLSLTAKFEIDNDSESSNLLTNGDFSDGSVAGWQVLKNGTEEDPTVEGDSNYVSAPSGISLFQQVELEAGVEYTATFDFKFDDSSLVEVTYDSFYRAGFTSEVAAMGNAIFVGPFSEGNKYYNIFKEYDSGVNKDDWTTHTFTFTPAEAMTVYFAVGSYNHQGVSGFSVDNIVLCKTEDIVTVTANAEPGGVVSGGGKYYKGQTVTLTAAPDAGFNFVGWFKDGAEVSKSSTYTFAAAETVTLTARFEGVSTDKNLVKNWNFEDGGWTNGWTRIGSGLNYIWDVNAGAEDAWRNGSKFVKSGAATDSPGYESQSRSFGQQNIAIEKNTDYVLGFWAKTDLPTFRAGVINNSKVHPIVSEELVPGSTIALTKGRDWAYYEIEFNSGDNNVCAISFGSQLGGIEGCYYYVDNVVLAKKSDYITVNAEATVGGRIVSQPIGLLSVGADVTVVAEASEGYSFSGWYIGDQPVSSSLSYNFTIEGKTALTARFTPDTPTPPSGANMITNGDFERGDTSGFTVVKTGGSQSDYKIVEENGNKKAFAEEIGLAMYQRVSLEAGVEYIVLFDFKFDDNAAVNPTYETFYRSGFMFEQLPLNGANFIGPYPEDANPYYDIYFNQGTNKTEWKNHTYTFTPSIDMDCWFVIGAFNEQGEAAYYVDNVVVAKKSDLASVKSYAVGPGSITASLSGVVAPGSTIEYTATPISGCSFKGWYDEYGLVSSTPDFTYNVVGDRIIYAQFVENGAPESQKLYNNRFQKNSLAGWTTSTLSGADSTITLKTEDGVKFAELPERNNLAQLVALKPGGTYVFTVKARVPKPTGINVDFYRMGLFKADTPNLLMANTIIENEKTYVQLGTLEEDSTTRYDSEWHTYTYTFTNLESKTVLANAVIGNAYNTQVLQVEYATFYEVESGVMDFEEPNLYGEEFYNYVENAKFENSLSGNFGTLPSGFSIKAGHTETGNKYLNISGSNSIIYKIKVDAKEMLNFGVTLKTSALGTASVSLVDKNGNPLGDSFGEKPDKAVYKPTAVDKWQRFGCKIMSDSDGYVYIKFTGGNNTLSVDDISLAKSKYFHDKDYEFYGDDSFDYNNIKYYNPEKYYEVTNIRGKDLKYSEGTSMSVFTPVPEDFSVSSVAAYAVLGVLLAGAAVFFLGYKKCRQEAGK